MVNLQAGGRYIITNVKGGTVIDLSGTDGRSIIGYPRHGGENQQWELVQAEGGWHIRNVGAGLYLNLNGQAQNDTALVGSPEPFVWHIWDDEEDNSTVRIFVPNTKKNVDLSDHGNPTPGTPISIWGRWEGKNQTWRLEQV